MRNDPKVKGARAWVRVGEEEGGIKEDSELPACPVRWRGAGCHSLEEG